MKIVGIGWTDVHCSLFSISAACFPKKTSPECRLHGVRKLPYTPTQIQRSKLNGPVGCRTYLTVTGPYGPRKLIMDTYRCEVTDGERGVTRYTIDSRLLYIACSRSAVFRTVIWLSSPVTPYPLHVFYSST